LIEGRDSNLFAGIHSADGKYLAQNHIAKMIALLGPPPKELLQRELEMRRWNFAPAVVNDDNTSCHKAYQYYKGPFFDDKGIIYNVSPGIYANNMCFQAHFYIQISSLPI
jgi:hypothetical protein